MATHAGVQTHERLPETRTTRRCISRSCGRRFAKAHTERCDSCGRRTKWAPTARIVALVKRVR